MILTKTKVIDNNEATKLLLINIDKGNIHYYLLNNG